MILISLQPLSFSKALLLIIGIICLSTLSAFAGSLYVHVDSTPYDRQMTRVQPILAAKGKASHEDLPLAVVNHWIQDLREIPYGFTPQWKTPDEVRNSTFADCKGKAVALYQRMSSSGAQGLRLVIGKRTSSSRKTHAWLEWNRQGGTFVLDPTINWMATRADQIRARAYIPLYAYTGGVRYRATSMTLLAKN